MTELTCIVCPIGCSLNVIALENGFEVQGARCKRGEAFALKEMTAPTRSISSTVRTAFLHQRTLPVRTNGEIPKDMIFPLIKELKKITMDKAVKTGDVILKNACGTGIDVIATTDLSAEE